MRICGVSSMFTHGYFSKFLVKFLSVQDFHIFEICIWFLFRSLKLQHFNHYDPIIHWIAMKRRPFDSSRDSTIPLKAPRSLCLFSRIPSILFIILRCLLRHFNFPKWVGNGLSGVSHSELFYTGHTNSGRKGYNRNWLRWFQQCKTISSQYLDQIN